MVIIKEKFKNLSKSDKFVVILAVVAVAMVVIFISYMIYLTFKANTEVTENPKDKGREHLTYDPSIIPTYPELSEVMGSAVEEVYGMDYYDLMDSLSNADRLTLPNSNVSIERYTFGDAVDLAVITALIYYNNPYLEKKETLSEDSPFVIEGLEAIKELPSGGYIDLATLEQHYSDIKLFYSRENPLIASIEGSNNGARFSEDIDLTTLYQYYFYH